jgi:hypothetical protein
MASLAELVRLAERIAAELPEVTRNEWMRWSEVACRRGLAVATQLAGRLATDITVRPAIQRAKRLIAQAVRAHRVDLERLSDDERRTLFGFVAWHLRVRREAPGAPGSGGAPSGAGPGARLRGDR